MVNVFANKRMASFESAIQHFIHKNITVCYKDILPKNLKIFK